MEFFPDMARRLAKASGFAIIEPELAPCLLPIGDWHRDSFLARRDNCFAVWLVHAREPGNGAWRRLLDQLHRIAGAEVVVVEPLGRFRDHLERHGWCKLARDGREIWIDPRGLN